MNSRILYLRILLLLVLAYSGSASAETTTFTCEYGTYADEKGTHKEDRPFQLTFLLDTKAGKAYLIGNQGSAEVEFIANNGGFTLVEITGTGNVMVTVITFKGKSVHSRGTIFNGEIIPAQYYGSCTRK